MFVDHDPCGTACLRCFMGVAALEALWQGAFLEAIHVESDGRFGKDLGGLFKAFGRDRCVAGGVGGGILPLATSCAHTDPVIVHWDAMELIRCVALPTAVASWESVGTGESSAVAITREPFLSPIDDTATTTSNLRHSMVISSAMMNM